MSERRQQVTAEKIPIILCCGEHGRAVIFGYVATKPVPGKPVTLSRARMILYWSGNGGLFGVASNGPAENSRVTCAVDTVTETRWQEWLSVSAKAAKILSDWPVCGG